MKNFTIFYHKNKNNKIGNEKNSNKEKFKELTIDIKHKLNLDLFQRNFFENFPSNSEFNNTIFNSYLDKKSSKLKFLRK